MRFDLCVIDWTALGVAATSILASITVCLSIRANKMNKRLIIIEESRMCSDIVLSFSKDCTSFQSTTTTTAEPIKMTNRC